MGKGRDGALECCVVCGGVAVCGFLILLVLALLGLGIAKIVLGSIHLHDCSIEKMIPIYLIVSGIIPLVFSCSGRSDEDGNRTLGPGDVCGLIGFLFQISWLICGTIWVYPSYGKLHSDTLVECAANVTSACYRGNCNQGFMTFAFAMVTIDWILFLACMGAVCSICYQICGKTSLS